MFIKNDLLGRYVNGTRCTVVGFDKLDGWPQVKTYDHKIITAEPEEWKFEDNGVIKATLSQIPLRLAWAITIHKSQGMTLDAAEIDLGDAFEPGMGYVALSRVRTLKGLKLMNLNEMALTVHPKILLQDHEFRKNSEEALDYLQALSETEKATLHKQTLTQRFEGDKTKSPDKERNGRKKKSEKPSHEITLDLLQEHPSIEMIAEKRGLTVGTIVSHVEKLRGQKLLTPDLLEQIKNEIPKNDFKKILSELQQTQGYKLYPVYNKFEGKYDYSLIQVVRLFV